jgi:hypothetical protein
MGTCVHDFRDIVVLRPMSVSSCIAVIERLIFGATAANVRFEPRADVHPADLCCPAAKVRFEPSQTGCCNATNVAFAKLFGSDCLGQMVLGKIFCAVLSN